MFKYTRFLILFVSSIALNTLLVQEFAPIMAQSAPAQLVHQGVDRYKKGDYRNAIPLWKTALTQYQQANDPVNSAIVLENLARVHQRLGQTEAALRYWEQAIAIQQQRKDAAEIGRLFVEQAQVYSQMGQPKRAIALLCNAADFNQCDSKSAIGLLRSRQSPALAAAFGSLGEAYRLNGENQAAIAVLNQSLAMARSQNQVHHQMTALNSLGNAHMSLALRHYQRAESATQSGDRADALRQQAETDDRQALNYLQQARALAKKQTQPQTELRSLLSILRIQQRFNPNNTTNTLSDTLALLQKIPESRDRIYATIDLVRLRNINSSSNICSSFLQFSQAEPLLNQAIAIAHHIDDQRAESFALGELGHLYECNGKITQALNHTQSARWTAEQDRSSNDSLYLWEWQTGRILARQGKREDAIAMYERAIATLNSIRSDILTTNRELQFDFRDTIEPIYRELIALRLDSQTVAPTTKSLTPNKLPNQQANSILKTLDTLRLAELQNYFGNDCVLTAVQTATPSKPSENQTVAVLNSIILNNRTVVILNLPNGETRTTQIPVDRNTLRQTTIQYRRDLEQSLNPLKPVNLQRAQKLYQWLIRPFISDLERSKINTLVFVQDGILRSVPMAALHDGQKFLVQHYAIATTPSLSVTDLKDSDDSLRALVLGLTQGVVVDGRPFPALPNVGREVKQVSTLLSGSKFLINQGFTRDRLQQELKAETYPVLHIATHGTFGSDPEDTFLVTGDGQKLTLTVLDRVLRQFRKDNDVIDLLALTACQTAIGDDRAALGLAGIAVQAGAKSAIASLWSVDDTATADLMHQFYLGLRQQDFTKAQAMQQAQISLIESEGKQSRPGYWAPFILVGNWL